ncbi:bifunctional riboflavin kinase/FAD synthetase [Luteolibacter sp. SL250]|uniref:bifunctional riboflavin kinase/FAD synthetase n=1 Tax=Luteolibacter sp. SL250 TaxID=2995170 RepID=UPI00226F3668|nr:bifunctional riboflavin kinase/FAD synthetase [Luteolibacter sp. SL250]WAC21215.1 bifunctional riboflavin kinase/FAD synthetase [Luteolibacter sp. SL250]
MITVNRLEDLPALDAPLHLALGVFDGVHIGHRAVIGRAVDAARRQGGLAGVLTFDPHPIRVIAPAKAPSSLLATLGHKAHIVGGLGAELLIPLRFDQELAAMDAARFLDQLLAAPVRTIAVGEDWRFGKGRHGDVELLQSRAETSGFRLEAVPPVMIEGERVSSTRIRQAIRDGNLSAAATLLGRPYSVCGPIVHGRHLGRTIGFPTANVSTGDAQLPPDGVWAVTTALPDGKVHQGVANLGVRPTVDGTTRALEVHLFDFSEEIYGTELEVTFVEFLRPEKKFADFTALQRQIEADAAAARKIHDRRRSPGA